MFHVAADYLRRAGWTEWDVLQLPGAGVVWWIFRRGRDVPAYVGKFCRLPGAIEGGRRECATLETLSPFADHLGIPKVLFRTDAHGGFIYLQSGVPGKPLRNELSPADGKLLLAQMDIAEKWLEKFQTLAPPAGDSAAAFRQVLAGASEQLPELLLSAAGAALPRLAAVPAVAVHGDFWARNVLISPGRVSVVDWDGFHYGSPVEDLCTFAIATAYQWGLDARQGADVIWDVLLGSSPLTVMTRAAAFRTLARWNISRDLLAPLFLIALVSRLGRTELDDNPAWHVFAARYASAGLPPPLETGSTPAERNQSPPQPV
ncbi:MAG: phosphotransferase [Bryobacteraceae bacterium]|jgi:hypothetical protein